jgi:hypothetical protein
MFAQHALCLPIVQATCALTCTLYSRPQLPQAAENPAAALVLCERQCEWLVWEVSEGFATQYGRIWRFLAMIDSNLHASDPHKLMIQYL